MVWEAQALSEHLKYSYLALAERTRKGDCDHADHNQWLTTAYQDIAAAVANANGLKMYVCNVAGEAGETAGLSLLDHLNVIRYYAGTYSVDIVIANDNLLGGNVPETVSLIDPKQAWQDPAVRVLADIIDEARPTRHEPAKLAAAIAQTYRQHRGKRRRLPLLWHNVQQPAHFPGGEPVGANQQSP